MTALPLFTPVLPPGTSPARLMPGEAASEGAGLFALLLAGMQPVQADVAQGADPPARHAPALAPALAGDCAWPPAAPKAATNPQAPPPSGSFGAEASGTMPAATSPPALPGRAQAGSAPGSPLPQLAPAGPGAGSPVPAFAPNGDRSRMAPAPPPTLADPSAGRAQAAGDTAAPPPPTVAPATPAATTPFAPLQTPNAQSAAPEPVPIALEGGRAHPLPPRVWSLQTGAPRAATDPPLAEPHPPASASAGERSIAAPGHKVRRPHPAVLAPTSGPPEGAADQPEADDQVWRAPRMAAPEGAAARSEQAATEPARAMAPGRSAPPAPTFHVGVQIARAVPARIDRLFVRLEPAALGRVEVRLEFHRDNQVSAVIAAERPDTPEALQRDARVLERSLHQAGLRLDSDGLTFSLKREQAHDHPHEERRLAPPAGDLGDRPLLSAHGHEPAQVQWFRGLRTLDIRV